MLSFLYDKIILKKLLFQYMFLSRAVKGTTHFLKQGGKMEVRQPFLCGASPYTIYRTTLYCDSRFPSWPCMIKVENQDRPIKPPSLTFSLWYRHKYACISSVHHPADHWLTVMYILSFSHFFSFCHLWSVVYIQQLQQSHHHCLTCCQLS